METQPNRENIRRYSGISFRPEVLQHLDVVAEQIGMNRSWVINSIVAEHAKRNSSMQSPSLLSKEAVILFDR